MDTEKPKYAVPYSFRMTAEEYQRLCEAAGSRTISDYIRRQLLGEHVAPRPPRRRPVEDAEILSALLSPALANPASRRTSTSWHGR